jgi:D-amino peptidase
MRVALSFDMEGVSQLTDVREVEAAFEEYWDSGRHKLHADVVAAAEGLLAGGADEVVLLDNHGSGNPVNLAGLPLPAGARLVSWHPVELREHDVDAQLQVGYHARGGINGFLSHTYCPGLRLRVAGELISESHVRAWGAGIPLIGIIGSDRHAASLGSLGDVPFLVVQDTVSRAHAVPRFQPEAGYAEIRAFARDALREVPALPEPPGTLLESSLEHVSDEEAGIMEAAGWRRTSELEFQIDLVDWTDSRGAANAAMGAAFLEFGRAWSNELTSKDAIAAHDADQIASLRRTLLEWAGATEPEWYE